MNSRDRSVSGERRGVYLIEDHLPFRAAIRQLINREKDFYVCGESDERPDSLSTIMRTEPSLLVMDLTLKSGDGIELTRDLTAQFPNLPILVVSMHSEDSYAARVLLAGARGYLMKHEVEDKFIWAIREVLAGQMFLSERLQAKFGAPDQSG